MDNFKTWVEKAKTNALNLSNEKINICVHVGFDIEDELILAHCLEFDIVAEGYTEKEATKNILNAIVNHVIFCIANDNIDKILNPAPSEYWNRYYFESIPTRKPYKFPPDYTYENMSIPFIHNLISSVEFNKSLSYAKA